MVWCARESADFEPGDTSAMQLCQPYGWIHWDALEETWHTVTGYRLGKAGQAAVQIDLPRPAAVIEERRPVGRLSPDDLAKIWDEVGPIVSEGDGSPAGDVAPAAGPPPTAAGPAVGSADRKHDDDRASSQRAVDNARWDTQHTLDNARWDTRHSLDNARWDSSLALKRAREDAALAADMSLLSAVHTGYVAVAQGSLDRAVQRATYVTTAAGAIGTLYTAVLAVRYTTNHQAPARSILPALFIGAAVAFSTWYMAFLRGHTREQQLLVSGTGGNIAETRLLDFMEWTFSGVLARAWSLRVSVIALALGLAMLPIGMVQLSSGTTWLIGLAGVVVLALWLAGEAYVALAGPGVDKYLARLKRRPPRLARELPVLPAPPSDGFYPTGPPFYGMVYEPPAPPSRADGVNPPRPPDVAAGSPPAPPDVPQAAG